MASFFSINNKYLGKSAFEIKNCFGIEQEFTNQEIDDVLKENPWLKNESSSNN